MKNILFKNEKYINTVILKNCQSTLGAIYLKKYFNYDYIDHNEVNGNNNLSWGFLESKFEYNEHYIDELQKNGYKKFVVWRDPFDRFLSLYKDMHVCNNHQRLQSLGLNNKLNQEEFLKKYLEIKYLDLDEHIRPQYKFYRNVDFIVPIENVNKFIINELNYEPIQKNSTNNLDKSIYKDLYKFKDIIYENYKEDLELIEKYNIYK